MKRDCLVLFREDYCMTLSERIIEDMKTALKGGEKLRLETLRTLRAQFIELSKRGTDKPLTSDDELSVLATAIKKRKEAIDLYQKAGREELVQKESAELRIIQEYLPQQISVEEADAEIQRLMTETGSSVPQDFGKLMGAAMKSLKGKIEGKIVQELVKKKLGG